MSREKILALFEFIGVVMALPEVDDEKLYEEIKPTAEEQQMSLLTIAERKGREVGLVEGREEGLKQAIADILEIKFGVGALRLGSQIEPIASVEVLQKIRAGLKQAQSLEEAEAVILAHAQSRA